MAKTAPAPEILLTTTDTLARPYTELGLLVGGGNAHFATNVRGSR